MEEKKNNLMIPYGIADFKRIRNEGWYYVDKTEYLAKLESRDSFVFFVRSRAVSFHYAWYGFLSRLVQVF